jgi:Mrp family chromosome partitioning ATPase
MSNSNTDQVPEVGAKGDRMSETIRAFEVPLRKGSKYTDVLLQRLQAEVFKLNAPAVIGVASIDPGEGVTTTALNLAIRAADHRISPTLVVDANFQNHRISRVYRTGNKGLSDCLTGQSTLASCTRPTKIENLSVLGLGQRKTARQLVIATQPTIEFLDDLREAYRLSIIDLPPINEPSLADAFLPHLDGVLVVARYGTRREKLQALRDRVHVSGGKIVGAVMTGTESKLPGWLNRFF